LLPLEPLTYMDCSKRGLAIVRAYDPEDFSASPYPYGVNEL